MESFLHVWFRFFSVLFALKINKKSCEEVAKIFSSAYAGQQTFYSNNLMSENIKGWCQYFLEVAFYLIQFLSVEPWTFLKTAYVR